VLTHMMRDYGSFEIHTSLAYLYIYYINIP
jgi:hypothetical protein